MLDRIELVGDLAFILLVVFALIFSCIDEKEDYAISKKLQEKEWPTVVLFIWLAIALVGVWISIFRGHIF